MKTPHKHAALIKAWADGAEIEETFAGQSGDYGWHAFYGNWEKNYTVFRIKPEPKPDIIRYAYSGNLMSTIRRGHDDIRLTINGDTGKLKSTEVIS